MEPPSDLSVYWALKDKVVHWRGVSDLNLLSKDAQEFNWEYTSIGSRSLRSC
jgi:hypothetical protein